MSAEFVAGLIALAWVVGVPLTWIAVCEIVRVIERRRDQR